MGKILGLVVPRTDETKEVLANADWWLVKGKDVSCFISEINIIAVHIQGY